MVSKNIFLLDIYYFYNSIIKIYFIYIKIAEAYRFSKEFCKIVFIT